MKLALKKASAFGIAGLIYLVGQYFRGPWFQNLTINSCEFSYDQWGKFCNSPNLNLGLTLMILGEWLLPTALILLLADERAFSRFVKFSLWYVPLMLFIIFGIFPVGLPLGGAIESAAAARALAVLYALAALGIVLAGKLRKPAA